MEYPNFIDPATVSLTEDGQKLVNWMEATLDLYDRPGADANIGAINRLDSSLQFYYTAVKKMKSQRPFSWLKNFPEQAAAAYNQMKMVEAAAARDAKVDETAAAVTENTDRFNELDAKLTTLQETLGAKVTELEAELEKLRAENEALKAKPAPKGKKAAKVEAEPEADEEATPAESE